MVNMMCFRSGLVCIRMCAPGTVPFRVDDVGVASADPVARVNAAVAARAREGTFPRALACGPEVRMMNMMAGAKVCLVR